MGNLEWVRRFGSADIVGMRSKEAMSKTGIRPWVASYLSVTKEGDDWLPVLVRLIMASHGTEWKLWGRHLCAGRFLRQVPPELCPGEGNRFGAE